MSQLLLPIFPHDTQMITPTLGIRNHEGSVFYLHCGMPIYSHEVGDLKKFRYVTSNLIHQGLCTSQNIIDTFHVSSDSVRRWKKLLVTEGDAAFFSPDSRHGRSHKLLPDVILRIQNELNKGRSANSIAKDEGIREGAIRYAITRGYLKKV